MDQHFSHCYVVFLARALFCATFKLLMGAFLGGVCDGLHCSQTCRIMEPIELSTLASPWRVSLRGKRLHGGLFGYYLANTTAIWPHELFAGIFQFHREAFDKYILGGGPQSVRAFWEKLPPRQGMQHKPNWRDRVVPLGLHGDGVSVSNVRGKGAKTMDTLSWTSRLSTAPSKLSVCFDLDVLQPPCQIPRHCSHIDIFLEEVDKVFCCPI